MKLNPYTWFGNRQLNNCPKHFIKCKTELTDESRLYVLENFTGRYFINYSREFLDHTEEIWFEDPQEAMMFELRWS